MAVVAVSGLPHPWSLSSLAKLCSKATKERFDVFIPLNFYCDTNRSKTGYVRIPEKLDAGRVVEQINAMPCKALKLKAFVPDELPHFPLSKKKIIKLAQPENNPENILPLTHKELMYELQAKFYGLYNLSKKTGHKLLRELANQMFSRLTAITSVNGEAARNCIVLSKLYRKKHPHFGDFQFILSTLHTLQDANGVPRTQINEEELMSVQIHPYMYEDIPYVTIQTACMNYAEEISKTINEHINSLDTEENAADSEEDAARKKVRRELKKMTPSMSMILQQVSTKHFIPMKPPYLRIWVYGEPFLPGIEVMRGFLRRHCAGYTRRSTWTYNLMRFNIPPRQYWGLMAMDGTVINGAKLVIRSSDTPKYKIPTDLLKEWLSEAAVKFYKAHEKSDADEELEDQEMIDEEVEEQNEME